MLGGRLTATIPGHAGIVTSVRVSPDGTRLASAGAYGTVALTVLASGRPASPPSRPGGGKSVDGAFGHEGVFGDRAEDLEEHAPDRGGGVDALAAGIRDCRTPAGAVELAVRAIADWADAELTPLLGTGRHSRWSRE